MNTFCFNQGNILLKMQLGKFYNFTHQLHKHPYHQKIDGTVLTYWFIKFIFGPFANLPFGIGKPSIWSLRVHTHFVLTTRILTGCQADASEVVGKAAELLKREANMVKLQV